MQVSYVSPTIIKKHSNIEIGYNYNRDVKDDSIQPS